MLSWPYLDRLIVHYDDDHVDGVRLMSQKRGHQRAYCSSPGWYVSMDSGGGDDAGWEKLLTHPPQLSGNPTSRDIWKRLGGMG
jgi:hypothetical protein